MKPSIQLASGKFFNFETCTAADIQIADIAHHLSMLCRFTGAVREFYSVAQHSVLVSHIVPREFALVGLLHDATEAYINDLSRPMKLLTPEYVAYEKEHLWPLVAERFNLPLILPPCIKEADNIALVTERRDLMPVPVGYTDEWDWARDINPLPYYINPQSPAWAKTGFIQRWEHLTLARLLASTARPTAS